MTRDDSIMNIHMSVWYQFGPERVAVMILPTKHSFPNGEGPLGFDIWNKKNHSLSPFDPGLLKIE